jgi:hypothetical protein
MIRDYLSNHPMKTKKENKGLFTRLAKHRMSNLETIHGGIGSTSTGDNDCTNLLGQADCGDDATRKGNNPPTMDVDFTDRPGDGCK